MIIVSMFTTIATLILCSAAASLSFFYFVTFRHRAASWMATSLAGFLCFIVALLCVEIGRVAGDGATANSMRTARLVLTCVGAAIIAHAVPRFLLAAFGTQGGKPLRFCLAMISISIAALSAARIVMGWSADADIPPLINNTARIFLYVFIVVAFAFVLIFQSRLPDRNLFKTVLAQLGTLLFLTPLVILEDLGLVSVPPFPNLGGLAMGLAFSVIAILHGRRSFSRPKYVEAGALSTYFAERFGISARELEVAAALMEGLGNAQIADRLCISVRTVENHLHRIYEKTGLKSRLQLYNLLRSDSM